MSNSRIIDEKYWNQFREVSSDDSSVKRHDGKRFEDLVHKLLEKMYNTVSWERTQMTHDGNKDFKGYKNNELYWAECKNYSTKIDLKTLAATLVMAEIENVNAVLFFCYSEINENTKRKLCSFSKSTHKVIYFYDGSVLDQLILKYKENILEEFFPEYLNESNVTNGTIKIEPQMFCYLERNPLLSGSVTFDMDNLEELQELRIGEIIGVHLVVINRSLSHPLNVSYYLEYKEENNAFYPINADIEELRDKIKFQSLTVEPGKLCHKIIYLKFNKYFPIVNVPQLIVSAKDLKQKKFSFGTISAISIHRSAFLGDNYISNRDRLKQVCLNKKYFSVALLYGGSGTGKTRMMYECSDIFLGHGYQIINFKMGDSQTSFYSILQELIFALYGFDEMIIEHIIENNYEDLDAYSTKKYKEIFKIVQNIYNKRTSLSDISLSEFVPIYEKMASGQFLIILDDIQTYSDEVIDFFHEFTKYAFNLQRKCSSVLFMSINIEYLHNQQIKDFLTIFEKSNIEQRDNIYKCEVSGFEKEEQSQLLLKETLGIENDIFESSELRGISLRPKYIIEFANLLVEKHTIETLNGKAFVTDKTTLKSMFSYLSLPLETIISERWQLYTNNSDKSDDYYKILISCLIFCEEINLEYDKLLLQYSDDIYKLYRHGFLKKLYIKESVFTFEHSTVRNFFMNHYSNWFESAISFYNQSGSEMLKKSLQYICNIYVKEKIDLDDLEQYKKMDFSYDILFKLNEFFLRSELNRNFLDNISFSAIAEIIDNTREKLGEDKAGYLYKIFDDYCDGTIMENNIHQYCKIMLDYAENQLKLKNTEKSTEIYERMIQYSLNIDFEEKPYMLCKIYNRLFVCGRVGGQCQQNNYYWLKSVEISRTNKFCALCIENHFDKAQSLFLVPNSKGEILRHLEAGCRAYENLELKSMEGHYCYRKFQISFLQKEYKNLYYQIENALHMLLTNNDIQYKLFFKIQFLIFKIMLCLLGEHDCTDTEIENMLAELNLLQSMQNQLQLYRCYYLYGKYYTQRSKWEQSFLFYKKTLENLNLNNPSEEIQLQKSVIFKDMMINFKKYSFPFEQFDFSCFGTHPEWDVLLRLAGMSDKEFSQYYDDYVSPATVTSVNEKDGYLLF